MRAPVGVGGTGTSVTGDGDGESRGSTRLEETGGVFVVGGGGEECSPCWAPRGGVLAFFAPGPLA